MINRITMNKPLTHIDLFAGAGGITEGFRKAGYKCLLANDFDEEAMHTFTYNHPNIPFILKDIKELTVDEMLKKAKCKCGEVDLITGGPPCQGFSLAGQRLQDDPRNVLFREYIRLAKGIQPKVIFFENVGGLLSMQKGKILQAIISEFREIGYSIKYKLINAADYGVPQARPRVILIGVNSQNVDITFPIPTHGDPQKDNNQMVLFESMKTKLKPYLTVADAISDLPIIEAGEGEEEMYQPNVEKTEYQKERIGVRKPGIIYNHRATNHAQFIIDRYVLIPQGCTNSVLPEELRTKKNNLFRLSMLQPARTITCNFRTDLINPIANRGLTVREAARLQSFDDDYRFFGNLSRKAKFLTQDDQVGNAVPPILAYAFAKHIKEYILPQFIK